jgi:hypothetical protein
MAISQVQVFNLALIKLGQDICISIDDDVEAVRKMRAVWEFSRDAVLAEHPWKFAILRAELAALAAEPEFGWSLQYALPEPCLKVVQVGDDWVFYTVDYQSFELEGGRILTDIAAPLQVRYVQRVENTGLWPVLFAEAVAMKLAANTAKKITGSRQDAEDALGWYELAIRKAKRHSAIERPPQRQIEGAFLASRGD